MDVWVTQVGSGQFHNLTHGTLPEVVNPSVRTLGFSPDGSLVTFWVRRHGGLRRGDEISTWAVATLGGQPQPYLEGVAEYDWSRDGSQLTYHSARTWRSAVRFRWHAEDLWGRPIFTAPAGLHSHFPLWSPDGEIYLLRGRGRRRTSWTLALSLPQAELRNGSRLTTLA